MEVLLPGLNDNIDLIISFLALHHIQAKSNGSLQRPFSTETASNSMIMPLGLSHSSPTQSEIRRTMRMFHHDAILPDAPFNRALSNC